uniref:non-specific serine/threonine protein kinase n=1 Tax=Nelumbo nucifera TaxID=4432 RepID=A0A822Y6P3_NELNU|nr:TPA_asm: hypothetical protein HUJ06_028759 [Nelumbo nucifera]
MERYSASKEDFEIVGYLRVFQEMGEEPNIVKNLDQNYLTGSLPAFLGNLSKLQYLQVGINALSGTIPPEIGNLKELVSLAIGSNNFSGAFPPQIGNLVKLKEIWMDSSGVGGEIPSTFKNLVNMETLWAFDNKLSGKIPDFIGNWTKLTALRLQGNNFEGPMPSSLSKLVSLTDLRIGELSNTSSTMDFIKDMKSLTSLVLRNCMISGTIPPYIGEFQNLQYLDLSFNNLTGQIPNSLFNLRSLRCLSLGNNSLSGSLPAKTSKSLIVIDLSYNELSGSFPSWVVTPTLQVNLVANNFIFDRSNSRPCFQVFYNFSIKCGGPEMASSTGVEFERDNETLGPASYFVSNIRNWGISNVGLFNERKNPEYIRSINLAQITGTLNPEFFLTARQSPGSIRYYGLGLENGTYNVQLQFAEIVLDDASSFTWQSHGRRVFDIYVQGSLRSKDFDIRKEAGGVSKRVVEKNIKAQVSENFLEIHLFWAGKGTCCIPNQGDYGPLISAISVTPDFNHTVSGDQPLKKKERTGLIVGIVAAVVAVTCLLIVCAIFYFYLRRKNSRSNNKEELLAIGPKAHIFNYSELKAATEDFNPKNKLGEGGFGSVYKGTLLDGRIVAVKELSVASNHGKSQFLTEISTISAVQQRNLVKLYGCCIEGNKRHLVYDTICLGTARGLAYLHEESRPRIVHRDVKASNILLDAKLNPKISDFGLAKLYDENKTHISTRVAGTIGYLAPEYALRGHLTEKVDVFGFGVVTLEILSGRSNSNRNTHPEKICLLDWAWSLREDHHELELMDSTLNEFDEEEARRAIGVALLCTQASPTLRPSMSRVVAMLAGDVEVSAVTTRPGYLTDWQFNDITGSFTSNVSSTTTAMSKSSESGFKTSSSTSGTVPDPSLSPLNVSQPMLHEFGEGTSLL